MEDGAIVAVGNENFDVPDAERIDASGLMLSPGFIDLQINGVAGADFTRNPESISDASAVLPQFGTTGFLPTIISADPQTRAAAIRVVREHRSRSGEAIPLGLHFEGPYLSTKKRGTHRSDMMTVPDFGEITQWIDSGLVAMVTIAPEVPGAIEAIRMLVGGGIVVSIGHTNATYEQTTDAIGAGATYATHLLNAMPPVSAREPGAAVALLEDERVVCGVILDGHHLHGAVARLAARCLGPRRLSFVSDATAALGQPDGSYAIGGTPVTLKRGAVRNAEGALAGSALALDRAVEVAIGDLGVGLLDAVAAVTSIPNRVLGRPTASIESGHPADLVLLDGRGRALRTWVGGAEIRDSSSQAQERSLR
jgi:N-acetylglucosamine-6-phosphate deacetylase